MIPGREAWACHDEGFCVWMPDPHAPDLDPYAQDSDGWYRPVTDLELPPMPQDGPPVAP